MSLPLLDALRTINAILFNIGPAFYPGRVPVSAEYFNKAKGFTMGLTPLDPLSSGLFFCYTFTFQPRYGVPGRHNAMPIKGMATDSVWAAVRKSLSHLPLQGNILGGSTIDPFTKEERGQKK